MNQPELLDAAELLQVALQATERQDSGAAIEYLKRLLRLEPEHPLALYLLGAQQAQIGLFDHARANMAHALVVRPDLDVARFQLGWIEANAGDLAAASATWQPLEALGAEHPFVLFKKGLLHFARNELADCLACLEQGVAANSVNLPLNTDMRKLIEVVKQRQKGTPPDAAPGDDGEVPTMYLKAYTGQKH